MEQCSWAHMHSRGQAHTGSQAPSHTRAQLCSTSHSGDLARLHPQAPKTTPCRPHTTDHSPQATAPGHILQGRRTSRAVPAPPRGSVPPNLASVIKTVALLAPSSKCCNYTAVLGFCFLLVRCL